MAVLLVAYDLNAPGRDYTSLIDYLKSFATWWHNLDSTWIVVGELSAWDLCTRVRSRTDANDEVLVLDITGDAAAWAGFSPNGSDWLKGTLG